jgi:hypothetical protein
MSFQRPIPTSGTTRSIYLQAKLRGLKGTQAIDRLRGLNFKEVAKINKKLAMQIQGVTAGHANLIVNVATEFGWTDWRYVRGGFDELVREFDGIHPAKDKYEDVTLVQKVTIRR